jgi:hypothetical protein
MGYLDNSSITVDAILTKHGRLKLAQGQGLGIIKFALADDGINYNLWNTDHISGSDSYGQAIKDLPMLEAVPDDTNNMKYKLMTLDRNTVYMPYIDANIPGGGSSITLVDQADEYVLSPKTKNAANTETYTFLINDMAGLVGISGKQVRQHGLGQLPYEANFPQAVIVRGKSLKLQARPNNKNIITSIQITGDTTGANQFITVQSNANILNTVKAK